MKSSAITFIPWFRATALAVAVALSGVNAVKVRAQQPAPPKPAPPTQQTPPEKTPAPKRRPGLADKPNPTLGDVNADVAFDRRVIVMMAALNVAGYDYESGNRQLSALRRQIREDLRQVNPAIINKLRDHFQAHRAGKPDAAAVAPYLSLALSLTEPPAFNVEVAPERLPEDVRDLMGFTLLLEEFYQAANFSRIMPKYAAAYSEAAKGYGESLALAVSAVITYLHTDPILELPPLYIPRPQTGSRGKKDKDEEPLVIPNRVRKFIVMPDLLNATGTANLRIVRDAYYLLLGPTTEPNMEAMRRAYLSFVIDPLTEREVKAVAAIRSPLKKLLDSRGDKLDPEYKERSAFYLITDSLVRATDARMAVVGLPTQRNYKEADAIFDLSLAYERGAVLVYHFYDKMAAYDQVGINLRDYFHDLIEKIDFEREAQRLDEYAQRLARYKQAKLEAAATPAPPPTISNADEATVTRILEADRMIKQRRYDEAKAVLEGVRRERPKNARALFGLADVTSKKASLITDSDRLGEELFAAVELYKQAAENASLDTEKWLAQRSYLAAGKILAFLGQNNDANAALDLAIKLGEAADKAAYDEAVKEKKQLEQKSKP
jgi:hypothetical protein